MPLLQLLLLLLIILTIALNVFYYIVAYWSTVRAMYRCVNLKKTLTGQVGKCFNSRQGSTCHDTDLGYVYGWCNDVDNHGALPGNRSGPYSGHCDQWSWDKGSCPPTQCRDIDTGCQKKWGWCADEGVNRAMIGAPCGPKEDKCDQWIWTAKSCPSEATCKRKAPPLILPIEKKCRKPCPLVCGKNEGGETLVCPPPNCQADDLPLCKENCMCSKN